MSKPKSLQPIDQRTEMILGGPATRFSKSRIGMIFFSNVNPALGSLLWSLHVARQMKQQEITTRAIQEHEERLARAAILAAKIGDAAFFIQMASVVQSLTVQPIPQFLPYYIEAANRMRMEKTLPTAAEITAIVNRWLVADGFKPVSLELITQGIDKLKIPRIVGKNVKPKRN